MIRNTVTAAEFRKSRKGRSLFRRSAPEDRTADGITFASKAEMKRYRELKALRARGNVAWFIREPRFDLLGCRYSADFLIVWTQPSVKGSSVTVEEVKPANLKPRFREQALRAWRRNAAMVKEAYGIDVTLVEM
jgi:hypothetical protein